MSIISQGGPEIVTLMVNRPGQMNAFNPDVFKGLEATFRQCGEQGTRVIILRGAPIEGRAESSSAGADLNTLVAHDEATGYSTLSVDAAREHLNDGLLPLERIARLRDEHGILVIGGVDGYLDPEGAKSKPGFLMAGAVEVFTWLCHWIIVSEDTTIAMPEFRFDGLPGWRGPQRLRELMGDNPQRVLWLLANQPIDGLTAAQWGVVTRAVKSGEVFSTIEGLATEWVKHNETSTSAILELATAPPGEDVTKMSVESMVRCMVQPEWAKKVGAFLDKMKSRS